MVTQHCTPKSIQGLWRVKTLGSWGSQTWNSLKHSCIMIRFPGSDLELLKWHAYWAVLTNNGVGLLFWVAEPNMIKVALTKLANCTLYRNIYTVTNMVYMKISHHTEYHISTNDSLKLFGYFEGRTGSCRLINTAMLMEF